jgi:ATP-binding protein involved in chromosome partitioning
MTEREALLAALATVIDPELRRPLTELGMVGELTIRDGVATAEIKLTVVGCPAADRIRDDAAGALLRVDGVSDAEIRLSVMTAAERDELTTKLRAGRPVKTNPFTKDTLTKVFLVGSGKGGVGKTSVTVNLAVALAKLGHSVGLIDADIFGFSVPGQLGLASKPVRINDLIVPPVAFGVKVISIGMFLESNQPVAWRGPMLHRAVEQFLTDVYWGDLDFLLIDLPPGTGDVAISLGQLLPTGEHIVVTTPQAAAAEVAERSAAVGLQTGQRVRGVIENMSWIHLPDGSRHEIFGSGGGTSVAARLALLSGHDVPLLGQIPIESTLREGSDEGVPVVESHPETAAATAISQIAEVLAKSGLGLNGRSVPLNLG